MSRREVEKGFPGISVEQNGCMHCEDFGNAVVHGSPLRVASSHLGPMHFALAVPLAQGECKANVMSRTLTSPKHNPLPKQKKKLKLAKEAWAQAEAIKTKAEHNRKMAEAELAKIKDNGAASTGVTAALVVAGLFALF